MGSSDGVRALAMAYGRRLWSKMPNKTLSRRMFKSTVNSTIALILCLNPHTLSKLGGEPAMLPLIAVMVHPGRRFGTMLESALLNSTGLLLGNAYALFGRFIAQKICQSDLNDVDQLHTNYHNYRAALAWLAVLHILMLFFHGWMRCITHKFFFVVFPLFLVVHFTFTDNISTDAGTIAKNFTVPFFLGIAISLACNLLIFPEFGSSYLGTSIVQTTTELQDTIESAVNFFITPNKSNLAPIVKKKKTLRSKLNSTQAVLQECTYEISYSYLSPAQLKPTIDIIREQLSYTNALINACQLQLTTNENLQKSVNLSESALTSLRDEISKAMSIINTVIAYAYDVKDGHKDIDLQAVNFEEQLNSLARGIAQLDIQLKEEFKNLETDADDLITPNDKMFLMSSFHMNFKETANNVCNMLKQSERIYRYRVEREKRGFFGRRVWVSFLFSKDAMKGWYAANRPDVLNDSATLNGDASSRIFLGDNDKTIESKSTVSTKNKFLSNIVRFYKSHIPHIRFGMQIAVGLTLATFPMFVPEARHWFVDIRGTWIGFVCILVLEPELGSTFFVFFLRGVGVISGAAWGYLSYVSAIHQTNPYLEVVVTVIGAIPGYYYFLGTPYVKAAIIGIISIYIVLLSAVIPSEVGGTILQNFGKRCLAMIYGGAVALLCQITFPIKARDELIKEVVESTGNISKLLLIFSAGLDGENLQMSISQKRYDTFKKLSAATKSSLTRADVYREDAKNEPRLKGNYRDIEKVFYEIIFILREILDRLDNIVQLRRAYGSAIIEEFNKEAHPYRRQTIASMSNTVKAVGFALQNKSPLPQYLPSSKIAHDRLLLKVNELVKGKYHRSARLSPATSDSESDSEIVMSFSHRRSGAVDRILKGKFLSWNASSAAIEEVIQYIEELTELTKVLVGVNEFKYGFLSRSLYSDYAAQAARGYKQVVEGSNAQTTTTPAVGGGDVHSEFVEGDGDSSEEESYNSENDPVAIHGDDASTDSRRTGLSNGFRKRVFSLGSWFRGDDGASTRSFGQYGDEGDEGDIPLSLMRVVSRKSIVDRHDD
ncbi:CYFA0S25e00562g1_1 [Cyberlindnera fabianii]|uniref:CYFA0S25e00562g1_1 n=1 Tax=Cyberlindnera fabianii TaxID=36022 RepID=A0A061B9P6_CYBFA|nr:CYFA0S25e00562g1_1 [Cyberlindnera fabianii]